MISSASCIHELGAFRSSQISSRELLRRIFRHEVRVWDPQRRRRISAEQPSRSVYIQGDTVTSTARRVYRNHLNVAERAEDVGFEKVGMSDNIKELTTSSSAPRESTAEQNRLNWSSPSFLLAPLSFRPSFGLCTLR